MAIHANVDGGMVTGKRLRVLVVRASFASLGGAERELLTVLREWGQRWEVTVATLALPKAAQERAGEPLRLQQPPQVD